jgi:thiosulfate reductase cytochrome b subunit
MTETMEHIKSEGQVVYRHSVVARLSHWLWALALLVLVMSGLQIFNAAPYLDASDKSDPAKRVLAIGGGMPPGETRPVGMVYILGHTFNTTGYLGFTDDGQGGQSARAFPGWMTLPSFQDLASGRVWHLFFAWMLVIALVAYAINLFVRKDWRELIMRPDDFRKLLPMQLYYLRLRKEPPPHGTYNPLQKLTYNIVLFVMMPLIVLTGLALSPGIDAIAGPLTTLLGGRQFARLWHFLLMSLFIAYFATHMILVFATGAWNNVRSMITGNYRLGKHDGVGP